MFENNSKIFGIIIDPSRESNKEITEVDCTAFAMFLEEMKEDYQNASPQLCTALDKFVERYRLTKSKSIPRLTITSYLYDLNHNLARVKGGSMIRVQVKSVKRRKTEGSGGRKRKLPNTICEKRRIWILTLFLHEKRRQQLKKVII